MRAVLSMLAVVVVACHGDNGRPLVVGTRPAPPPTPLEVRLPRTPGQFAPSLLALGPITPTSQRGEDLADVDTCGTCHVEVTAQWQSSLHSFASFANPIYRTNVELIRAHLGQPASQHCGGCHDMPLAIDGAMRAPVVADDLRAHTGVACRVCHAVSAPSADGNASFVLGTQPLATPNLDDPASIAAHKAAVDVKPLGDALCVACHRGFLSPDLGVPVHLTGVDEPSAWRNSAWAGNGAGRVDKVERAGCVTCHMPEVAAGPDEYGHDGKVRAHTFAGGHTWMAAMRKDPAQLARIRKMLEGTASIDVAGAIVPRGAPGAGPPTVAGRWHLPADGAPVVPGQRLELDVVVRNLLTGHRFPGGVVDMQDTWIEVEVTDARGRRVASSGLAHAADRADTDAHVLRAYPVDERGAPLQEHELHDFRAVVSNQTIAARDAIVVRYALDVPTRVAQPLAVHARLRHRSRSLANQASVCAAATSGPGKAFLRQALALRDMVVDPCAPQPITEVARTTTWIGAGAEVHPGSSRPSWERSYEHGMALVAVRGERLDEARAVLEYALTLAPAEPTTARAAILVQLGSVAAKQGRVDDALALVAQARALLPAPGPAVLDAVAADALVRVWRWADAEPFARVVTEKVPGSTPAWVTLARVRGSLGDNRGALAAAVAGLALTPRDSDLLRSQATAVAALAPGSALAAQTLEAFDRYRAPDDAAQLRMACAAASPVCAREREQGHTHALTLAR
ncbi:MAG: multiheme c-type cytochrome [Kofleriaceae bacterium]